MYFVTFNIKTMFLRHNKLTMKILFFGAILAMFLAGCDNSNNTMSEATYSFYVGTYTEKDSEGIYKFELDANGSITEIGLVARSVNPSFLAFNNSKTKLIAVNEMEKGTLELYRIEKDSLIKLDVAASGGAHPCFVTSKNNYVLTANYSGGNIGLLSIDNNSLSGLLDLKQHFGKKQHPRQEAPHAHSVWFVPNTNEVIAVDLGSNELWFYKLNTHTNKLETAEQRVLAMADFAGPRHLCFHPDGKWIYVVNELNSTVSRVVKNEKAYVLYESVSTLPEGFKNPNTCADIHISDDGRFLYVSNRGHNSIAIFKVGSNGSLQLIGHESTKGDGPRNFSLSPDGAFMLVANQHSNNLVSFEINEESGLLSFKHEVKAYTPVCILFQ